MEVSVSKHLFVVACYSPWELLNTSFSTFEFSNY